MKRFLKYVAIFTGGIVLLFIIFAWIGSSRHNRYKELIAKREAIYISTTTAMTRKAYAENFQNLMLSNWVDAEMKADGKDNTDLEITLHFPLTRPFLYNFVNHPNIMKNLKREGFKRVMVQDKLGNISEWILVR